MMVKLIKSNVREVVERWGSLPKLGIMVVISRRITQQEARKIKYQE